MRIRLAGTVCAVALTWAVCGDLVRAGEISGRREGMFGDAIHESFIWAVGEGANSTTAHGKGMTWVGNYAIQNLPAGQYWVVASEHGANPYNFIPYPVSVGSGTTTLNIHDRHTMSSSGLTDLGTCTWAAQSFIATGRDLAQVVIISPTGGKQLYITIREDSPVGPQIGPGRHVTTGSLFPSSKRYQPGEVPLTVGRRYVVRFDGPVDAWRPAVGYEKDPYPNGQAWIDGEPIPEADLSVSLTCRDTGYVDGYRVDNWWRPNEYTEYVQTFVADGPELRLASIMLAEDVGFEALMRASVHAWGAGWPYGAQIGVAKHARMGANVTHAFVWGPGECPLTTGQLYAIRFVRTDGQPYAIYGDSDQYTRGQAYFDGVSQDEIDMTGRLIFREVDRPDITAGPISFTPLSATQVRAQIETAPAAFATVAYRRGAEVFDTIVPAAAQGTSHVIDLDHLAAGATFQMWVIAYDPARDVFESTPVPVTTLATEGVLTGRVTTQYGSAGGAEVVLAELGLRVFADASGRFSFPTVPTGRHTILVQGAGLAPVQDEVVVNAGATTEVNLVTTANKNLFAGSENNPIGGWTTFGNFSGQFNSGDYSVHTRTGAKWVGSVGNWSPKTGGMWRTVPTEAGKTYRFGVFLYTDAYDAGSPDDLMPGLAVARIGIDLTGGVNPDAASVDWRRYRFTEGQWLEQSIEFEAAGPATTLFVKHKHEDFYRLPPWYIAAFGDIWFGPMRPTTPDFDRDDDIDQADFGRFQACLTGPGANQTDPECRNALLDADTDVDADDFAIFQGCMSGADQPYDPACVE